KARPVVRRIAGDDPVVVVRIALRFHQPLLPALRAADVVGVRGGAPVERFGDRLAVDGREVQATVAEVGYQVGPPERPRGIERSLAHVSGIGAGDGVSAAQAATERVVADDTGHAAVTDAFELAVPAGGWKP